MKTTFLPQLQSVIDQLDFNTIPDDRKPVLHELASYIQSKTDEQKTARLNFICTHNSRRSQFSQLWAQVAAHAYNVSVDCFSGGTEATAFNERAVASTRRMGFEVAQSGTENPRYEVSFARDANALLMFSKTYDEVSSPDADFAAVMTCSHADENCPFIPGAEKRIPLRYEDPKAFDDTDEESEMYNKRSLQIATELFYVLSKID